MTRRIQLLIVALVACLNAAAGSPNTESFGIAASDDTTACVAFPGGSLLSTPQFVRIVLPHSPQRVLRGTLTSELPQPCGALAKAYLHGPYFTLQLDRGADLSLDLGIVLPERIWTIDTRGPDVRATGNGRKRVTFRSCTGNEGVHLAAWSGDALKGSRIWHEYYYLGYDVDPSCQPKDYE
jgi:hypothetical protein